jgi:hypothetical protein
MGSDSLLRALVRTMTCPTMTTAGKAKTVAGAAILVLAMSASAFAQVDLNGGWQPLEHEDWIERGPGPDPVDYLGLPLSDAGRAKALSYTSAELSMLERQCLYYGPHYVVFGPQGLRIWSESDPARGTVVAWKISAAVDRDIVTIWMDGRPHPSENAFYPFSGFTTGAWEGNTLTAHTTHVKAAYLRRNGVPTSDRTTVDWRIFRHGDLLTIMEMINDPIYLTEPHVVTRTWQLDPNANLPPTAAPCVPVTEVNRLETFGVVPHHLPGKNPDVNELTERYNIPLEAVLGNAETLYPEYRKKMTGYTFPDRCTRYCCGWTALGDAGSAPGLTCITNGSGEPVFNPPGNPFVPPPPR